MSDVWGQKLLRDLTGIRTPAPAIQGPQEAIVTKVGTAPVSIAGQTAVTLPCVWFALPETYGPGPGFGPAPYQPAAAVGFESGVPPVGAPVIVIFIGNGVGRPYVVSFPTAPASGGGGSG
jgi:hypothetical protein